MSYVEQSNFEKHVTVVHSSSVGGGPTDQCARCDQQIYPLELMGKIMGNKYHKQCFKCSFCDRNLDFKTYKTNVIDLSDKQIYCASHAPKNGKGTIDFQAADITPKTTSNEYEFNRLDSKRSSKRSNASAAEVIVTAVKNKSTENLTKEDSEWKEIYNDVKTIDDNYEKSASQSDLSRLVNDNEKMWKDIYEEDDKNTHQKIETHDIYLKTQKSTDSTFLNTQKSTDSAFFKSSRENLDDIKWEYLDFKAGSERPNQSYHNRKTPEIYRKYGHGPFDSAYSPRTIKNDTSQNKSWKEIYGENSGENNTIRSTKRSNLDLLDKEELSWREIYENGYKGGYKKEKIVQEVYQYDPPTPVAAVEKVIDSLSLDSSRINKIPSKEKFAFETKGSEMSFRDERIKSDSYTSTKETATYHHQLSDNSHQKHVSVMVPMIINNRESALDESNSMSVAAEKEAAEKAAAEQKQKVLDELLLQKQKKQAPVIEVLTNIKKVVAEPELPSTVIPIEVDSKPVYIVQKETRIIGENKGYGVCKLTVHYDDLRNRLSVTCHQAQNLKNVENKKGDMSDPYCRIYLVPDSKKIYKRKTKVVKNNLNPKWEETFDYKLSYEHSVGKDLVVSLKDDKKGLFSKQETRMLGEVRLRLEALGIKRPYTRWYFLQPLGDVSKVLLNNNINPYKN